MLSFCYFPLLCQVCEIIESPLFLKLNPMTKHTDVSSSAFLLQEWENTVMAYSDTATLNNGFFYLSASC